MNSKNRFLRKFKTSLSIVGRFIKPYPLRSPSEELSCDPFFIVSSGRAGTTLLRAILSQHSHLCIPPESDYLCNFFKRFKRVYRRHSWQEIVTFFCGNLARGQEFCDWDIKMKGFYYQARKLPPRQRTAARLTDTYFQYYAQHHAPDAVRWGDKTPHYIFCLPLFDSVFPKSQVIHIHRDGRDVVSSYLKLGWAKTIEEACERWLQRIQLAQAYDQRNNRSKFFEIRYEDMVRQPEAVISKTCEFLGIEYDSRMLDFHLKPDQFRGDSFRPDLHGMLAQPISTQSIGNWRKTLNHEQKAYVQKRLSPTLNEMGYDLG